MPMCFVTYCNHQGLRERCKFFRFPKDNAHKWERLCRRADRKLDLKNDRICSCHFEGGDKSNGPTIFPWNADKLFAFPDPVQRRVKRKIAEVADPDEQDGAVGGVAVVQELEWMKVAKPKVDHTYQLSYDEIAKKNKDLRKEIEGLEASIRQLSVQGKQPFTLGDIYSNEAKMLMYTSLKPDMFTAVDEMLQRFPLNYVDGWTPSISRSDQLLLTLIKLTMNPPLLDLAERFKISPSAVNNVFITNVCAMHEIFFKGMIDGKIPSLLKCKSSMPASFGDFTSCRIVIDATEISQDVPGKDLNLQAQTYSSYKTSHTVKSVTGVAPNAAIVYSSKLYPGSTSDVAIVDHCGLMKEMQAGDMILADKGFTIHKLLPQGVHLNIPPFLIGKAQYTPAEVQLCRKIGRSRIHVERANERIKNYAILRHIPHQYRYISTIIFQDCCFLVNLQDPLLQEIASNYNM